ncbi:MAG: hypothetical protein IPH57_01505 [Saprospiraceae bacterium]|nr:hypothetical protein [Saprospiraceae bacterium]
MIINFPEARKTSMIEVINWLKYNKQEVEEIEKIFTSLSIRIEEYNKEVVPQNTDGFIFNGSKAFILSCLSEISNQQIKKSLIHECEIFTDALFFILNNKKFFGNFTFNYRENKIIDIILAQKYGLKTPSTLISGTKKTVSDFYDLHKNGIITKSLGGSIRFESESEIFWGQGTSIITLEDIEEMPEYFLPSLFQKKIEKEYEIRTFLFKGKFYSMAIFSQKDNKTALDFRNYNHSFPNRTVPYKLPDNVEKKLLRFAKFTDLDTGSFDLIVTKNEKDYIFLEVNPYGQFGWLSSNCNYYLEKQIAEYFEN